MDYDDDYAQEQRRQKQMYLKTEIIDRGYDGAQFAEFLNTKRDADGANIDVWTLNELKGLVKEFRKIIDEHYGGPQNYEALDQQNYAPPESQYNEPAVDPNAAMSPTTISNQAREDIANSETIKEENYSQILTVKMSEHSPLNEQNNVQIIVGEPELVKGGLFSASYIQYKVTTKPFDWSVKRRFSDFFWLRSTLQKMHLGYVVPPVPQKKNKGKFENDFIRKRMYFLEKFLNSCVSNEEFKSNKFLYFFLSLQDENQMKAKRKESEKLLKVNKLEEVSTLSGQIELEVNPNLKYYAANAGELCNQIDPVYKKIRKLSKQLIADLDQVSNTIFSVGECYAALYAASTNFNKNVNIGKNPHLDDTYLTLNNMMVSWGEQVLGQIKIVQKNMTYFYKYAHYENESFKEVVQERGKKGLEYITKRRELQAKKERLYAQGDINRWELSPATLKEYSREQLLKDKNLALSLMCAKETAMVRELRDTFAYQNAMTFSELDHCFNEKVKEYSLNFHELAKSQSENLTEVHVHWADLMAHFSESKQKMKQGQIKNKNMVSKQENEFAGNFDDD